MTLPTAVQSVINRALGAMQTHPQHQLLPVYRLPIYQIIRSIYGTATPDPLRARLGIATARRVLPLWHAAMPLYPPDDEPGVDTNILPDYFLELAEQAWQANADLETIKQEVADYWYVVGNIELEIFEWREETNGPLFYAFYALDTAYKALHETLGHELLGRLQHWERHTDDTLPRFACDAASSAVIALSGGGEDQSGPPIDVEKRRAFWEWWLLEALPIACSEAAG
jgi:immunity protein Imm5 of predicted polymorphic toxin system